MDLVTVLPFLLVIIVQGSAVDYGVLVAKSPTQTREFCIIYFSTFSSLPDSEASPKVYYPLLNQTSWNACDDPAPSPPVDFTGHMVLLTYSNGKCDIGTRAVRIQELGGVGIIVAVPGGDVDDIKGNKPSGKHVNITVALISDNSAHRLQGMGPDVSVYLFTSHTSNIDFSLPIIWVIAMFTVIIGSWWSGRQRAALYKHHTRKLPTAERTGGGEDKGEPQTEKEEIALNISPLLVFIFVCCMGVMLLLLYFFFKYLVYFIIGLFVLASFMSVYACLRPLVRKLPCGAIKLIEYYSVFVKCNMELRDVLLAMFSLSMALTWLFLRKESYAWVLQDLLGVAFGINMLKTIRLPNLKICTVLLVLLFFYDIFFVFITPLLTVKGESVMVEVATGGQSQEQLPMVLKVPHCGGNPLSVCFQEYSLLGFGDILVPGLLVSYCHGFDLITGTNLLYFIVTSVAYGLGLIATYLGLYFMNSAQPALLYLVPFTLIPVLVIGWYRKEFCALWSGIKEESLLKNCIPTSQACEPVLSPAETTSAFNTAGSTSGFSAVPTAEENSGSTLYQNQSSSSSEPINDVADDKELLGH